MHFLFITEPQWYFPLDDLTGSDVYSNIIGNVHSSATLVPGVKDKAMVFDGVQTAIDFNDVPNLGELCLANTNKCTQGMTLSLWVKFHINITSYMGIWYNREQTDKASLLTLFRQTDNKLRMKFKTKPVNTVKLYSQVSTENKKWYHIGMTYKYGEYVKLYIDGCVHDSSGFTVQEVTSTGDQFTLSIGGNTYDNLNFANCSMDEIMVWKKYHEDTFIWQLYAHGVF